MLSTAYLDNLRILNSEQIAERRNDSVVNHVCHLVLPATDGHVAHCPGRLLLRLEVSLEKSFANKYFFSQEFLWNTNDIQYNISWRWRTPLTVLPPFLSHVLNFRRQRQKNIISFVPQRADE